MRLCWGGRSAWGSVTAGLLLFWRSAAWYMRPLSASAERGHGDDGVSLFSSYPSNDNEPRNLNIQYQIKLSSEYIYYICV